MVVLADQLSASLQAEHPSLFPKDSNLTPLSRSSSNSSSSSSSLPSLSDDPAPIRSDFTSESAFRRNLGAYEARKFKRKVNDSDWIDLTDDERAERRSCKSQRVDTKSDGGGGGGDDVDDDDTVRHGTAS